MKKKKREKMNEDKSLRKRGMKCHGCVNRMGEGRR